ncbi:hypothetical protein ABOONEI_2223 [Aciduliprofundum boonei T469]|nr:hypothetical protein ABOONEI_2223 [Aciduliprofundum boonei T469]
MKIVSIIAFACTILLLFSLINISNLNVESNKDALAKSANFYNPNTPPKTFEGLFLPHWFENGTFTFNVPQYMHHFKLAGTFEWAPYYHYGAQKGRPAILNVTDNYGNVVWHANNTIYNQPIGASGRSKTPIKGDKIFIRVKGKVLLQFGIWGDWTENILNGGIYSLAFNAGKIALYMDYYNPTNLNTFYFKSSQPVYAYLFDAEGRLIDHTEKPVKEGSVTEPYDASPFLTFIRPNGESGNVTVQFWVGYEEKKSNPTGAFIVIGILVVIAVAMYIYAKRAVYEKRRKRR